MTHCNNILRAAIVLSIITMASLAHAQLFSFDGLQYHVLSEEEATVETYYGGKGIPGGHFDVPEKVTDTSGKVYTVVQIGWYSFQNTGITSITLPPTIREIRTAAFTKCPLTEIRFPAGVRSIDGVAFSGCNGLHEVILPDSLLSVGDMAFSGCANLESVTFNGKLRNIGQAAFNNTPLRSVSLPNSLRTIGDLAFGGCKQLEQVDLGEGVEHVGRYAFTFDGSDKIHKIRLPESLKSVGNQAFRCDTLVCPWSTPPHLNNGDDWNYWVTTYVVPKGTTQHYMKAPWGWYWPNQNHYYVEDESLGAYCDFFINSGENGSIVCDSTVYWDGNFHYARLGQTFTVQIVPIDKYLIKTFTRDGNDMADLLWDASLWEDVNEYDLSDIIEPVGTYRVRNLQEPTTLSATFEKQKYTRMTIRQGIGGTITVRMHRDEPAIVKISLTGDMANRPIELNGEDVTDRHQDNGALPIGIIDDPITLEIK